MIIEKTLLIKEQGSVGEVTPGVELELSEGTEGEILTKGPWMFSRLVM